MSYPADFDPGPPLPELSDDLKAAIRSKPTPKVQGPSDQHDRLRTVITAIAVLLSIWMIAANWISIECWISDRLDLLPRDVALEKIKSSPGSSGMIPIKVTGIEVISANHRKVTFDWKLAPQESGVSPTTPPYTVFHRTVDFHLFDDGWRVEQ